MKKNKLLIFMPSIEDGGVEKNFFIISNYLSEKFKNVGVISISKKIRSKLKPKINLISLKNNYYDGIGRRKKFFICLLLLVREIILNRNIVVLCFQGNIYCTLLCKLFLVKVIIRANTSPSGWSQNLVKAFLYKLFYGMADAIIVNSLEFKNELKKKFNLNSICIFNPLNKSEIIKNSKQEIKFSFFSKKFINIICIARLSDQKDHLCFIDAINILKNKIKIKALIIGNGNLRKDLNMYIKNYNLEKNIKIINFQKNPFPYLLRSDLFVLSSKFEGLPNVLLEALALKKMIISSDCPTGPREILDKGKGGLLFKTGNTEDLVKKIIYFSKNKKDCKKKTMYGYNRLYRFDKQANLLKFFNLLNKFKLN